jgi:hypothetical protein
MEAQPEKEKMDMQRAVKRSQWQEGDRSLIRRMGQASTFLNAFLDQRGFRTR